MAALYNISVPLHQALSDKCWLRRRKREQQGGGGRSCFTVSNWLMFPLLTSQYSLCILTSFESLVLRTKMFNVFEQDVLDYAISLANEGDRLIENSHYAEDSIRPKCSELRGACEEISSTLRSKKSFLLRAMELHHALDKVRVRVKHPQFF